MDSTSEQISARLRDHYAATFAKFGANSEGVDWGANETNCALRYDKMLAVMDRPHTKPCSLLDVGCGFGGLLDHARTKNLNLEYTGIDIAVNMIEHARDNHPGQTFVHGDLFASSLISSFDYVVCNGILTQKLETPGSEMDAYANSLIRKMFSLSRIGIAFNLMSSKVNFYSNNLYYRSAPELMAWSFAELTRSVRIDHAYPLYEYTAYLYKE